MNSLLHASSLPKVAQLGLFLSALLLPGGFLLLSLMTWWAARHMPLQKSFQPVNQIVPPITPAASGQRTW
jgi:hypothetical protein